MKNRAKRFGLIILVAFSLTVINVFFVNDTISFVGSAHASEEVASDHPNCVACFLGGDICRIELECLGPVQTGTEVICCSGKGLLNNCIARVCDTN